MKIFNSASKVVFVLMAAAVVAGLFSGNVESKDFMMLASMAFAFYFSHKGDVSEPYAGK